MCCVQYPLTELVRLLAFENEAEAREFCEHHGLTVTDDGYMRGNRFIDPEVAFTARCARSLIHSKQSGCLGEVCVLHFSVSDNMYAYILWSVNYGC